MSEALQIEILRLVNAGTWRQPVVRMQDLHGCLKDIFRPNEFDAIFRSQWTASPSVRATGAAVEVLLYDHGF